MRTSRRDLLRDAASSGLGLLAAAGLLVAPTSALARPRSSRPRGAGPTIILGEGRHRYQWVPNWGKLPGGADVGSIHGSIAMDSRERLYVTTDSDNAVMRFDADGRFVDSWGKQFRGGLHGITIARHCDQEVAFLAHPGQHEVIKTTLEGTILLKLPFPRASGRYRQQSEYRPTSVAVAPNGAVYVADGDRLGWIHQYDASGAYVRSFGGPGSQPGQFRSCHALTIDYRRNAPMLCVADPKANRLQWFDTDGKFLGAVDGLRGPCDVQQQHDTLLVCELPGRVTILDQHNSVLMHLGDNPDVSQRGRNDVPPSRWRDGVFISPHASQRDDDGNLYVVGYSQRGRVSKLRRLPSWSDSVQFPATEKPVHLFNGKNLQGWRGQIGKIWKAEHGLIRGHNAMPLATSTYLFTERAYGDFRIIFEVRQRVGPGLSTMHSALCARGEVFTDKGDPYGFKGPLLMFCHDYGIWDAYGRERIAPPGHRGFWRNAAERVGQWNRIEILALGARMRFVLNGELVFDIRDPVSANKVSPIGLQVHSNNQAQDFQFIGLRLSESPEDRLLTVGH